MLSDNEDQDKCRERRRRRIEMRRLAVISVASSPPKPSNQNQRENTSRTECSADSKRIRMTEKLDLPEPSYSSSGDEVEASPAPESEVPPVSEPVFGSMSVSGRSRDMEDTISVRTSLCRSEISTRRPVHFFAVFDGHGGPHVAALCRERMHEFVKEELTRLSRAGETGIGSGSSSRNGHEERQGLLEERWRTALRKSFERMDEVALSTCTCGRVGYKCRCHPMEVALGGSTAVVALLSPERIVVANCGDSRAVLCRAGTAIPLSQDHKPDRSDELARIEAAGGRVIFVNGARVEGILAMSRAIGDKYLKPYVTSEPEITFTKREPEDECLILASDGLWDVLSSELACEVARECLREETAAPAAAIVDSRPQMEDEGAGALYPSRSVLAAALLTRLALGRKSSDNISVIVVDLTKS
ncbi:probable protein phosphatase 2C 75 isoform X1 [Juglans microcarpa x Juglans regia]|uniref:probable protein phosphatase 2C 75 isoform X1 n=1 Tax=Juglans microcarpa x Juglans regia TaxID=2249226 RepID=UPI001B7DA677|nr:probable protein phosphatase 2C 75 isoform X1 [Juglans microcarpa x Juglans regia]